jgi:GNAT superfamily N-acetyltransferase
MAEMTEALPRPKLSVRLLRESELAEAASIFRLAFGTFMGLPDPETFSAGRDFVEARWRVAPDAALAAEREGTLLGTNFAANWGTFACFGPLTVRPEAWNQGVAQALLDRTMDLFSAWQTKAAGLFTFANSTKHIHLYQKYGFWPRFLTAVMSKPVAGQVRPLSEPMEQHGLIEDCRELTDGIFEGLDATREIREVDELGLGEIVTVRGDSVDAFAVCHYGARSEAGPGRCYIKFAAVRPGPNAEAMFIRLLEACETAAADRGLERIEAGVNLARGGAYRVMLERGFRNEFVGVAMQRPDAPAYNRPDVYVLDDWR